MSPYEELLAQLKDQLSQLIDEAANPEHCEALSFSHQAADPKQFSSLQLSLLSEANAHFESSWAAHMTPTVKAESLVGLILAGLHNGNLLSPHLYPVLADIEQQLLTWLCSLFKHQYGHFVPGGSYGNLEALWQAKQNSAERRTVYCSSAAHYSIAKACQILDLDLVNIETNDDEQINVKALEQACLKKAPLAIVVTAGTSSAGNFDEIADCIAIAKQFSAWLHIDAAWGGALIVLDEYAALFKDIALADSLSFDPHKAWGQPKPCSVVLYQTPLAPFLSADSHYLDHTPNQSLPGSYGGESFLPLCLSLLSKGTASLENDLRYSLKQANIFASFLKNNTNWPVYTSPSGIVCFESEEKGFDELIRSGVISSSIRGGKPVYRAVFTGRKVNAKAVFSQLQRYL